MRAVRPAFAPRPAALAALAVAFLLVASTTPVGADQIVYFANGKAITVKSIEKGKRFTVLEMEGGGRIGVPTEQIVRIEEFQGAEAPPVAPVAAPQPQSFAAPVPALVAPVPAPSAPSPVAAAPAPAPVGPAIAAPLGPGVGGRGNGPGGLAGVMPLAIGGGGAATPAGPGRWGQAVGPGGRAMSPAFDSNPMLGRFAQRARNRTRSQDPRFSAGSGASPNGTSGQPSTGAGQTQGATASTTGTSGSSGSGANSGPGTTTGANGSSGAGSSDPAPGAGTSTAPDHGSDPNGTPADSGGQGDDQGGAADQGSPSDPPS